MSVRRVLSVAAMTVALAACGGAGATNGGGQPTGVAGTSLPPGGTGSTAPAASGAGPVTGHLGDKLTFENYANDTVDATLVKIYDPATPNDPSAVPLSSATHWVGFEVIVNDRADYETDSGDFDAVTSAGIAENGATAVGIGPNDVPVLEGFKGCTQTDGEPQTVTPYTYCEAFPVPDGQTLVKLGLNVTGAPLVKTDQATWTVP